jgi:hypothetical protein
MRKKVKKVVAGKVIEGGRFVRVTLSREETVLREGTADLLIEAGTELDAPDDGFDLDSLADLLESLDAIDWADESHLEDWRLDSEYQQEDLPDDARDTAVAVRRNDSGEWEITSREGLK